MGLKIEQGRREINGAGRGGVGRPGQLSVKRSALDWVDCHGVQGLGPGQGLSPDRLRVRRQRQPTALGFREELPLVEGA